MKYQVRYKNGTLYYIKDGIAYRDLEMTVPCKCPSKAYLIRQYDDYEEMVLNVLLLNSIGRGPQSDRAFLAANGYFKEGWENNDDPIGFVF